MDDLLAVSGDALAEFAPFFCGLYAHAENLAFFGDISFGLVDKGRHLGPAPGSPPAPIEKDDGCRSLGKGLRKFDRCSIDIEQSCRREGIAHL